MASILNESVSLTFVHRVLEIFGEEADAHGELFWRVTNGQLHFYAQCNDFFWWAAADAEEITPENLPILEQALIDVRSVDELWRISELFASRVRKMRPQRPCYLKMSPPVAALFDACGPVRDHQDED